jgi:hypothetical protein
MDNCSIQTVIEGKLLENGNIGLVIISDCKSIQKLSEELKELDLSQIMGNMGSCAIYQAAAGCLKHLSCLVPAAIIRTAEIEMGIALPGESSISTQKS